MAVLNVNTELLENFAFYAAICLLKVLLMAFLTGRARFKTKTFANAEDAARGGRVGQDEEVERVRRAHLNDLENILPFVLLGLLYVLTANPELAWATKHFQVFTAARIAHTIVYVGQVPQPARAISFFAGLIVCLSMAYQIIF